MKRFGNLFHKVFDMDNLRAADAMAQKGKQKQPGVIAHNKNKDENLLHLSEGLAYEFYTTSPYTVFSIQDPKPREIFRLPYYPDRIAQHAIMQVISGILESTFTADTYGNIAGRGIHKASYALQKALKDVPGTKYCLKLDIRKFYPSVDHSILKQLLRRKIKDVKQLSLLDNIIDSAPGLPIGNYMSQTLSNFYLSPFDHWIKEQMRVRYYFRYVDDIVIPAATKEELHQLLQQIKTYLNNNLNLEVKSNYQIFPVDDRGIDWLGYVHFHGYTRVRKRIKKAFARKLNRLCSLAIINSYHGWLQHANCNHLLKKLFYEYNKRLQGFQNYSKNNRVFRSKDRRRRRAGPSNIGAGFQSGAVQVR